MLRGCAEADASVGNASDGAPRGVVLCANDFLAAAQLSNVNLPQVQSVSVGAQHATPSNASVLAELSVSSPRK